MLVALGELRGVDRELPVERQVVVQCQELAHHDEANDRQQAPEDDGVEPGGPYFFDGRHQRPGDDRQIGQQETTTAQRTFRRCGKRRCRSRTKRGDCDQQVTGGPAHVDSIAGPVLIGRGQIEEAAVRQQVGDQATGEQIQWQTGHPGGAWGQDHDHGADEHVADRVGEPDQIADQTVRARAVDGPEHSRPTDDQERSGDQHPIEDGPRQRHGSRGGGREAQDRGDRKWDGGQVAEVSEGWERHLLTLEEFDVRPSDLTRAPRERRDRHQRPGDAGAALMLNGGVGAGRGRQECDDEFADVIESLRGNDPAPAKQQPGREKQTKCGPRGEHDEEATVVCHLCRFSRLYRQPSARVILKALTQSLIGLRHGRFPRFPSPHGSPPAAHSLPRSRGRVREGVAYFPASPTVTWSSLSSPARMTRMVWVAPTFALRRPVYRSSRLLVVVPLSATSVSPCIRPALSAGLCGSTATISRPVSCFALAFTASGSGTSWVPMPRYGRRMRPSALRLATTRSATSMATARPSPRPKTPPFMPTARPSTSTSGPPLNPG